MTKRKYSLEQKIGIITLIVIIILGIPTFYLMVKDVLPKSERCLEISIKGEIDKPLDFNKIIDFNSLNLFQIYPDSITYSTFDKTSYEFGDIVTITMKLELTENFNRYVSAFLIDNNNLVRMSFPSLNDQSIVNQILTDNLTIKNIFLNDVNSLKYINETLKINFYTENQRNFISNGNWHVVIILWKQQNSDIIPTIIFSENIVLGSNITSENTDMLSLIFNVFFSILTAISIIFIFLFIRWIAKRIMLKKMIKQQAGETHVNEQGPHINEQETHEK